MAPFIQNNVISVVKAFKLILLKSISYINKSPNKIYVQYSNNSAERGNIVVNKVEQTSYKDISGLYLY